MKRPSMNFQQNLPYSPYHKKMVSGYYPYPNQPRLVPINPSHINSQTHPRKHVTNNIMIVQPKPNFNPVGLSSSSRQPKPVNMVLENSGTSFKIKNMESSMKKVLSPGKTNSSLSPKSQKNYSPKSEAIPNFAQYPEFYPVYDNRFVNFNRNQYYPIKSPNFNKNYFAPMKNVLPENSLFKIDPAIEREALKKVMQIFLKMDTVRKKEIGIYKSKLIPIFQKLGLRSHRMKTLNEFLEKFLMEEKITEEDVNALNVAEKLVFMAFLVKKKYFDVDCFEFTAENISFFQDRITVKRNEQEYKIVLKKAFKTMISAYNQEKGHYDSSKRHFYLEYFGDFATSQSIPLEELELENLFNEKGKAKAKKRKSKKNYAQILRTSPVFLKRLTQYLDNKFSVGPKLTGSKHDAIREIKKKVPDLINKWKTRMLMEEDNPPHIQMAEFLAKFFTNKKVKLPWSVREINRAVKSVKHLLQIN